MFVLGVDPGLSRCGFGAVRLNRRAQELVAYGVLSTPHTDEHPARLGSMSQQMRSLMATHQPDVVVVERVFFQNNARTAIGVAQASGLAIASAVEAGAQVVQYTANEVKLAITGFGAADKAQVQRMVATILGLDSVPKPADAADALALALHHLAVAPFLLSQSAAGSRLDVAIARAEQAGRGVGANASQGNRSSAAAANPFGNARVATNLGGVRLSSNTLSQGPSAEVAPTKVAKRKAVS